jgi:hypothetical protein
MKGKVYERDNVRELYYWEGGICTGVVFVIGGLGAPSGV